MQQEAAKRQANMMRPARVTQVDAKKGLVKVTYCKNEKGEDVESCWLPWTTRAGKIKIWAPPSVGEQVIMYSPGGAIGQHSWITPGGFSKNEPQNHDADGEYRITVGGTSVNIKDGQILEKTAHKRTESGKVEYDNRGSGGGQKPGAAIS